ncbi:hypothetical protein KEM54_005907, partial [Ascosphaera aggregata]
MANQQYQPPKNPTIRDFPNKPCTTVALVDRKSVMLSGSIMSPSRSARHCVSIPGVPVDATAGPESSLPEASGHMPTLPAQSGRLPVAASNSVPFMPPTIDPAALNTPARNPSSMLPYEAASTVTSIGTLLPQQGTTVDPQGCSIPDDPFGYPFPATDPYYYQQNMDELLYNQDWNFPMSQAPVNFPGNPASADASRVPWEPMSLGPAYNRPGDSISPNYGGWDLGMGVSQGGLDELVPDYPDPFSMALLPPEQGGQDTRDCVTLPTSEAQSQLVSPGPRDTSLLDPNELRTETVGPDASQPGLGQGRSITQSAEQSRIDNAVNVQTGDFRCAESTSQQFSIDGCHSGTPAIVTRAAPTDPSTMPSQPHQDDSTSLAPNPTIAVEAPTPEPSTQGRSASAQRRQVDRDCLSVDPPGQSGTHHEQATISQSDDTNHPPGTSTSDLGGTGVRSRVASPGQPSSQQTPHGQTTGSDRSPQPSAGGVTSASQEASSDTPLYGTREAQLEQFLKEEREWNDQLVAQFKQGGSQLTQLRDLLSNILPSLRGMLVLYTQMYLVTGNLSSTLSGVPARPSNRRSRSTNRRRSNARVAQVSTSVASSQGQLQSMPQQSAPPQESSLTQIMQPQGQSRNTSQQSAPPQESSLTQIIPPQGQSRNASQQLAPPQESSLTQILPPQGQSWNASQQLAPPQEFPHTQIMPPEGQSYPASANFQTATSTMQPSASRFAPYQEVLPQGRSYVSSAGFQSTRSMVQPSASGYAPYQAMPPPAQPFPSSAGYQPYHSMAQPPASGYAQYQPMPPHAQPFPSNAGYQPYQNMAQPPASGYTQYQTMPPHAQPFPSSAGYQPDQYMAQQWASGHAHFQGIPPQGQTNPWAAFEGARRQGSSLKRSAEQFHGMNDYSTASQGSEVKRTRLGRPPLNSRNHPYIQALKQQQQQITAQQYQQLAAQQPAHVGPNGHGHAPAMLNGPAGSMRIPNANANGQPINPSQFVAMQAQAHPQVNPFARPQAQLARLPQGAQLNPAMRGFPLNPQIQQAIYAQAVQSVASRQNAAVQAAASAGQSLVFNSAQTHGQITQEFNARMAAFFASQQQRFHDIGQNAGRMNPAGINVGVSAPASATSGPGPVAAVTGAGLGVGPSAPAGSTLMNSASPHPSIAHPANTGRATPAHIGNVAHAGNQGATPGSTHHQTPPTTAGSQHPSHTQGPMASSAVSVSGNVPATSAPGRAGSLQPAQQVGQGGQALGTMGMHPPSQPSGLSMQELQMRDIQMRAAAQAQIAAQTQAHVPPITQVLANQGHPIPNPQVQGLNQAYSMYPLHTPVDLVARLNSYGEMVSAYTQHRDQGIDYWFNFVDQFYSPTGDLRFGLKDAEAGSKKFEIAFPVIPRYYFTQFRSGMDRIQIIFENTTQRQHPDFYHTVEGRATIIYWYRNGCLHTAWTEVKVIFNPDNLIELLEFSTQENREFLPKDSIIRINTEETADEAESIEIKPQRQGQMQTAFKLPRSIVRQFGVPTDVMSFLETAETLLTMTPLF